MNTDKAGFLSLFILSNTRRSVIARPLGRSDPGTSRDFAGLQPLDRHVAKMRLASRASALRPMTTVNHEGSWAYLPASASKTLLPYPSNRSASRVISVPATADTDVSTVPHARSTTVTSGDQPRSTAMLVMSYVA